MGHKTLISFNLRKYVEKHHECTAKQQNQTTYIADYIVPDLIDFFDDD